MFEQNSDVLKSNKCGLDPRLIVIQLYYSQVVNDIAEDLKVVFDKAGPAKLAADFLNLRKSALDVIPPMKLERLLSFIRRVLHSIRFEISAVLLL